jgi:membrane-associated phospholipid phosphatase
MTSERLAIAYFAALTVLSWVRPLPIRRRVQISAIGLAMIGLTLRLPRHASAPIRDFAPALLILIGYFTSGLFFMRPSAGFEAWLIAWDRRLLGDPAVRFSHWPRAWLALLDIIYMGCFLMAPAGFAAIVLTGHSAFVDRYWTMVMGAEFGAFLPLTIVQARPPWAVERAPALGDRAVHRLASRFVRELTIGANTFPSGHAAGSLAVALGVMGVLPIGGVIFLALAICICLACSVGRYHYVLDVIAGVVLAAAIWIIVSLL